jgi:hypothetical protein
MITAVKFLKYLMFGLLGFEVILFLLFGLPVLGGLIVHTLADVLDCSLSASGPKECLVLGLDIGRRLYGYIIPLVGMIFTPIAFFFAFLDVLIVVNSTVLILFILYFPLNKKFIQTASLPPRNSSGPWE